MFARSNSLSADDKGWPQRQRRARRSFGWRRPWLRWWRRRRRRPRPGLSRGGGQSARRARPRRPPAESSPRLPARRSARVCRGAWPAFGRFWPAFSWPRAATPEPAFAVLWPFCAGFGPAAVELSRGPHGGGAHAARGSVGGVAVVPSAGGVGEAVFSWAMERSIGIGHGVVSWRPAAEKVSRRGRANSTKCTCICQYLNLFVGIRRVPAGVPLVARERFALSGCKRTELCPPFQHLPRRPTSSLFSAPAGPAACRFSVGCVKRTTAPCGWCVARTLHLVPAWPVFDPIDRPPVPAER